MSLKLKDVLRKATVGSNKVFKKSVMDFDGNSVEFRSVTVRDRDNIRNKATDKDGNIQMAAFQIWAIIFMTYVPESDERVFEEADFESLMSQPAGSFVDKFAEEALKLLGTGDEAGKSS